MSSHQGFPEVFYFYPFVYYRYLISISSYLCLRAGQQYFLKNQICLWIFYGLLSYDQIKNRRTAVVLEKNTEIDIFDTPRRLRISYLCLLTLGEEQA